MHYDAVAKYVTQQGQLFSWRLIPYKNSDLFRKFIDPGVTIIWEYEVSNPPNRMSLQRRREIQLNITKTVSYNTSIQYNVEWYKYSSPNSSLLFTASLFQ